MGVLCTHKMSSLTILFANGVLESASLLYPLYFALPSYSFSVPCTTRVLDVFVSNNVKKTSFSKINPAITLVFGA